MSTLLLLACVVVALQLVNFQISHVSTATLPHQQQQQHTPPRHRVLLISFGGFRHDYIATYRMRHMQQFAYESARASHLTPQFTTQSLPNHWSMATGAYVETHGLVADKFYDPAYGEHFAPGVRPEQRRESKWWNATTPIWLDAARLGIKTAVYHWPGAECCLNDHDHDHDTDHSLYNHTQFDIPLAERPPPPPPPPPPLYTTMPYSESTPLHHKLNRSLGWLLHEDYAFVAVYHNQPDAISHKYGLNSPEFNVTLGQLDETFGALVADLKAHGLYGASDFSLLVVSDHGMVNVRKNVVLSDYLTESDAHIWSLQRNLVHLKPRGGGGGKSVDALLVKLSRIPDITITLREDMPERLHYRAHRRIGDIIVSAMEGVAFVFVGREPATQLGHNGRVNTMQLSVEQKRRLIVASADRATHGYDRSYPSMRGIFMAHGAMFRANYTSEHGLDNVDVYALLCHLLAMRCEARNASLARVRKYLSKYGASPGGGGGFGGHSVSSASLSLSSSSSVSSVIARKPVLSLACAFFVTLFFFLSSPPTTTTTCTLCDNNLLPLIV